MYSIGQSKKEARDIIGEKSIKLNEMYKNPNSPDVQLFNICPDVKPLQTHQNIQVWSGQLLYNARKIDDKLDTIFNKVIVMSDSTFSSKRKLKKVLKNLFDIKESVRNLEIDIEEFMQVVSITEHKLDSTLPSTAFQVLSQVNSTYKSTYDLTIYKLKSISNSRVTTTNILISLVALCISIIALFF